MNKLTFTSMGVSWVNSLIGTASIISVNYYNHDYYSNNNNISLVLILKI